MAKTLLYRKVKIREKYFNDIANYPSIVMAFQLSRLSNALITWLRVHLEVQRSHRRLGKVLTFKTRLDVTLQHAAVFFEVLKTFISMCNKLPHFNLPSTDLFQIEKWKRDFVDPNHIISRIIKPIRNKIAFHFEFELLSKLIRRFKFKGDRVFAVGKTTTKYDAFYVASDDLVLNFIASRMPSNILEIDCYPAFADQLVHLADSLSSLIDRIILHLVKPYGYLTKEKL